MGDDWREIRSRTLTVTANRSQVAPLTVLNILSRQFNPARITSFGPLDRPGTFSLSLIDDESVQLCLDISPVTDSGLAFHLSPSTHKRVLFRVHNLPAYVTHEGLSGFMGQYGTVLSIKDLNFRDPEFSHVKSGVREVMLQCEDISRVPHTAKFGWDGDVYGVLITSPQRPPLCFRCRHTGHTRSDCKSSYCMKCRAWGDHTTALCEVRSNSKPAENNVASFSEIVSPTPSPPHEESEEVDESDNMVTCHVITSQGVYTMPSSTRSSSPICQSIPLSTTSDVTQSDTPQGSDPSTIPESVLIPSSNPFSPSALVAGELGSSRDDHTVNPSDDFIPALSPDSGESITIEDSPSVCPSGEGLAVGASQDVADSQDPLLSQDLGTQELPFSEEEASEGGMGVSSYPPSASTDASVIPPTDAPRRENKRSLSESDGPAAKHWMPAQVDRPSQK